MWTSGDRHLDNAAAARVRQVRSPVPQWLSRPPRHDRLRHGGRPFAPNRSRRADIIRFPVSPSSGPKRRGVTAVHMLAQVAATCHGARTSTYRSCAAPPIRQAEISRPPGVSTREAVGVRPDVITTPAAGRTVLPTTPRTACQNAREALGRRSGSDNPSTAYREPRPQRSAPARRCGIQLLAPAVTSCGSGANPRDFRRDDS